MGAFDTQSFTADQATQFMNPYLTAALAPQLAEARRQSNISDLLTELNSLKQEHLAVVDKQSWTLKEIGIFNKI